MKKNKAKHVAKNESRKRRGAAKNEAKVARSLRATESKHRRMKHLDKKCKTGGCPTK